MNGRSAAAYVLLALVATTASWLVFERDPAPAPSTIAAPATVVPSPAPAPVPAQAAAAAAADVVTAYAAMRDDLNPKPRLQLIDAWARRVQRGDDLTVLSQAMVDPDASVRERAAELFERETARR